MTHVGPAEAGRPHLPGIRRRDEGAELIEFAFVLPLLLAVVAGIIDFGFLFQRYEVVTNSAREGARIAVLPGYTTADVQDRVLSYIEEGLGMSASEASSRTDVDVAAVTITSAGGGASVPGRQVTVSHTHDYLVIGPFVALLGGTGSWTTVTLTARSTMRLEVIGAS